MRNYVEVAVRIRKTGYGRPRQVLNFFLPARNKTKFPNVRFGSEAALEVLPGLVMMRQRGEWLLPTQSRHALRLVPRPRAANSERPSVTIGQPIGATAGELP